MVNTTVYEDGGYCSEIKEFSGLFGEVDEQTLRKDFAKNCRQYPFSDNGPEEVLRAAGRDAIIPRRISCDL